MARKAAGPGGGKKKRRRRKKLKLTLRSRSLKKTDEYTDRVGWSQAESNQPAATAPVEPQFVRHQCSQCGAMNQIPKPKRGQYKVECAHPECDNVDEVGKI
ncbi:MAG: hypothetical protein VYA86_03920 [Candidatus Thermoplasmatota archaeon]|nr:hypothetical protein [Candidatus Thermoplasmatota archaeon]